MAIKIKTQRDYFVTEVTIESTADPQEIDALMQSLKANGKVVTQYNGGKCPGINIEQKTRVPDHIAPQVRSLLGIGEKEL